MAHQLKAFNLMKDRPFFALLMEQGTGKTKTTIDDVARVWGEGKIDALLVMAPNGVHINWVVNELGKHMPDWCPYIATWYAAGATKRHLKTIEALFNITPGSEVKPLRVLTMNYDALTTTMGKELFDRFTTTFNCYAAIDESQRIKNPDAKRSQVLLKARRRFRIRRILSGTPATRAPFDIFSQYFFLDDYILRTSSYVAFKSEYAQMLPADHHLVKQLQR